MLKAETGSPLTAADSERIGGTLPEPEYKSEPVFKQELVAAIVQHFGLLLVGPLVIGAVAYGVAAFLPPKYSSISYLRVDEPSSKNAVSMMASPIIRESVLPNFPETGETPEERREFMVKNFSTVPAAPNLYGFQLNDSNPRNAQTIVGQLIDSWLETTKPAAVMRATLEAELERNKSEAASTSGLIDRLQKEATTLVSPNSLPGEIATPIAALIAKRDQNLASIIDLQNKLGGVPRDIIAVPPDLAVEPVWPKKGAIAVLSALAAVPVLVMLIVLGRFFAPGLGAREAISGAFGRRGAATRQ